MKLNNSIDNYYDLIAPETMLGTGMLEFTRPYFTCEEELFETPSMYLSVAFTPEMWNAFEEGHIIPDYILTDESILGYPAEGNMYYGLDVPVLYSFNVYYSPFRLNDGGYVLGAGGVLHSRRKSDRCDGLVEPDSGKTNFCR